MSLSLDDKQLLRSLSIMMVKDPKFARSIFLKFNEREKLTSSGGSVISSPIYKIDNVINLVINYDEFPNDNDYLIALRDEIGKLKDRDVKEILSSSL